MKTQVASVTSSATTQENQDHRSSGNFSTEEAPQNAKKFFWKVTQNDVENDIIRFDVRADVSFGDDTVEYSQVGNKTETDIIRKRAFYIADPDGAAGKPFLVTISAE